MPFVLLFALCLITAPPPDAWPEFRGPLGNGHSAAVGLPLTWSETEHVKWKTAIHGRAWSSPVIWGSQIWMTTATPDGTQLYAVCVDKQSGGILCDRKLFDNSEPEGIADINSYGSPTPVVEEGRVYVHFGTYGTACLDTKTFQTIWQRRDLVIHHSVGPGSSPILYGNLLILTYDGTDYQFTTALDKRTGQTVWKTDRTMFWGPNRPSELQSVKSEGRKAFSTPIIVTINGKPQLVSVGARAVYGYDPETGREIWHCRHPGYSNSSRTLEKDGMMFLNTGYDRAELWAVKLGGSGSIDSQVLWKRDKNIPFKPSSILVDDLYYMVTDGGIATCLDRKTGEQVWQERLPGQYSASPIYADGRLYFFSEQGDTTVLKPGRKMEVLATNRLNAGFMASPAVSGKAIYLRTKTHLYRIES